MPFGGCFLSLALVYENRNSEIYTTPNKISVLEGFSVVRHLSHSRINKFLQEVYERFEDYSINSQGC